MWGFADRALSGPALGAEEKERKKLMARGGEALTIEV